MANGQEKARQNLTSFQTWVATQTDDDFMQINMHALVWHKNGGFYL